MVSEIIRLGELTSNVGIRLYTYQLQEFTCNTEKHCVNFHIWLRLHSHCTKINFHIWKLISVRIMQTPVIAHCMFSSFEVIVAMT